MILSNTLGFLALVSIPALVVVYLIQPRLRSLTIATLFLLPELEAREQQARRFELNRFPIRFLLQVLAMLLLAWVLLKPEWFAAESRGKVAIVVDASFSMLASKEDATAKLFTKIERAAPAGLPIEWLIVSSAEGARALYRGFDRGAAYEAIKQFRPTARSHEKFQAFDFAREFATSNGLKLLFTDSKQSLPDDFQLMSFAEPLANVGFAGARVFKDRGIRYFATLVVNHTDAPVEREWWVERRDGRTDKQILSISPRGAKELRAPYPEGSQQFSLRLTSDDFPIDDVQPFVDTQKRSVVVDFSSTDVGSVLFHRILERIPNLRRGKAGEPVDVWLTTEGSEVTSVERPNIIQFTRSASGAKGRGSGLVYGVEHQLNRDLRWAGLEAILDVRPPVVSRSEDVLLLQGERPLVTLEQRLAGHHLRFLFDPRLSNLEKLPAFPLLLHRYFDVVRSQVAGYEAELYPLSSLYQLTPESPSQAVEVISHRLLEEQRTSETLEARALHSLRLPDEPAFVQIRQNGELLAELAIGFDDFEESDLSKLSSHVGEIKVSPVASEASFAPDPYSTLWIIILGLLCVMSWFDWAARGLTMPKSSEGQREEGAV